MKYFKVSHGKWHCANQFKNKFCYGPDGLIYCNSIGKPVCGILADGTYWI